MPLIQTTLNFQGQLIKTQKAIVQYDPFKKRNVYFLPSTGKSLAFNARNKRKLYLSGDLELKDELFINNRFVKDNKRNRSRIADRSGKILNPATNRWVNPTPRNLKKIEQFELKRKAESAIVVSQKALVQKTIVQKPQVQYYINIHQLLEYLSKFDKPYEQLACIMKQYGIATPLAITDDQTHTRADALSKIIIYKSDP